MAVPRHLDMAEPASFLSPDVLFAARVLRRRPDDFFVQLGGPEALEWDIGRSRDDRERGGQRIDVPRSRTHSDDEDVRNPLEKPARGYEDARDKTRKYSMS